MIITCPHCQARYRIDPARSSHTRAKVKCPGCATVFAVTLETPSTERPPSAPAAAPETAVTDMNRPLVLVVDDARFFREMIRDLLSELPIRIETAADGNEGWQMVRDLKPDLLLLDLNIPGMSGQELIAAVRNEPACRALPILAMSGSQRGEDTALEVRRLGADDFLGKSFKPRELQNRVRKFLSL